MRSLRAFTVGLAAVAAMSATGSTPASAAVATTEVRPALLDRGPNGAVPHVVGSTLVIGRERHDFTGLQIRYVGTSDGDYLVGTRHEGHPNSQQAVRVTPEDQRTVVLTGQESTELTLSQDGALLLSPKLLVKKHRTRLRAWDSHTGALVAVRVFRGFVFVLDADQGRAVLGAPSRTLSWDTATNTAHRISTRQGYAADIAHDRLASFTKDPFRDGCSVVSTLAEPARALWRSCHQAVIDFSPSATRTVTTDLLADGLGPSTVELRADDGTLLARWSTYWFGELRWESDDTTLMLAHGRKRTAWVRCTLDQCERASRLSRTRD